MQINKHLGQTSHNAQSFSCFPSLMLPSPLWGRLWYYFVYKKDNKALAKLICLGSNSSWTEPGLKRSFGPRGSWSLSRLLSVEGSQNFSSKVFNQTYLNHTNLQKTVNLGIKEYYLLFWKTWKKFQKLVQLPQFVKMLFIKMCMILRHILIPHIF